MDDDLFAETTEAAPSPAGSPPPARVKKDFEGANGAIWRVEDSGALIAAFDLDGDADLKLWQREMAGQGRPWELVRRVYGVSCLGATDPPPNDGKPMGLNRAASECGIGREKAGREIEEAKEFWRLRRAQVKLEARQAAARGEELEVLPPERSAFSIYTAPPPDVVNEILVAVGLNYLEGEELRGRMAARALDFERHLKDPTSKTTARQLLRMESDMEIAERVIGEIGKRLLKENIGNDALDMLSKQLANQRTSLNNMVTAHQKLVEALGATETEILQQKRSFIDQMAMAIEGMQEFYSKDGGEHKIVDGLFSEGEVEWLMTPYGLRPPQYRPDIAVMIDDWMKGIWDPEFSAKPVKQHVARGMLAIAKAGIERNEADPIHPKLPAEIDLFEEGGAGDGDYDDDLDAFIAAQLGQPGLSNEFGPVGGGAAAAAPMPGSSSNDEGW